MPRFSRPRLRSVRPQTRYAKAPDGVSIAYQVLGEGPRDLVWVPGWVSHIEASWDEPTLARFFEHLASFTRRSSSTNGAPACPTASQKTELPRDQHGGDGFLATFDGPARAIRCALGVGSEVRTLGLQIRAGVHTGEVELAENGVRGLAVHIGARIAALAGNGEVLVSRTVKDLVVGSGLTLSGRGQRALKGVPQRWELSAVDAP